MSFNTVYPLRAEARGRVIALHCSGANAGAWRPLREALGDRYSLLTPEHYGSGASGPWNGERAFTLADEAARTISLIDECDDMVHLAGHSYGGAVALHAALARPGRIASLTLYEPSAFHLLEQMGAAGAQAHAEIVNLARRVCSAVERGDHRGAMADFVNYWNHPATWTAMRPAAQNAMIRWAPKVPLEFRALIDHAVPAGAYRDLNVPVLVIRGQHAPMPARVIADGLPRLLPRATLAVVEGAGHMGPLTHAGEVAEMFARHIASAEPHARPRKIAGIGRSVWCSRAAGEGATVT